MARFLANRIISMFITLFLVITITFFLMHAIPGGPFTREKPLPPAVIEALEAKYKLDQPLWKQYLDYLKGVATFDLGPSFQRVGVTVNQLIEEGFPVSAKIGGGAVLMVVVLGIPLGVISALKQNKWQDQLVMILATLGVTIPSFVMATAIIYIFSSKLGWLPSHGLTSWKHMIGPVIALGGFSLSFVARLTRSSMLEVLQQDYIRTARAKGLSEFVVVGKHALKNALIPVVTYIGPMIAGILTGSFVIEKIFAIPGLGKHFVESVGNRDYTVLMGVTIFYAAFLLVMILIVDILYGFIDPRIKIGD
ncbi:oligopeptide transport system permease protein [Caminicella sporogenes DSM 14501]|uniref:Oligopeptide transport system permease protein n=1 Tax=Caminicella sporogenes DSM 14501 TaxID=1121266 RepID=A0A1M6SZV4_9FIRM|nr:ABC transporter permease [Caminicella sporogenes]RKD26385.1 peptide ABC transporter permease [Caminicella sporogenes]WIF94067.1 ABC transporter permease [Caminicella sporogenes]SHK50254.1 oligopeptide transport system permease protein [Caminicella sporogenes DSM 14501]